MFETVFIVAVCFAVLFKVVLLVVVISNVGKCNRMRQAPAQASTPAMALDMDKLRAEGAAMREKLRAEFAQEAAEDYDYSVPLDVDSIPSDDPQLW